MTNAPNAGTNGRTSGRARWLLLCLVVVLLLSSAGSLGRDRVSAQDVTEPDATARTVPDDDTGDDASTEEPTDAVTPESSDVDPTEVPTLEPTADEVGSEATATPDLDPTTTAQEHDDPDANGTPVIATTARLTYEQTASAACVPLTSDGAEIIAVGSTLDYSCVSTLDLAGSDVRPDAIGMTWSIAAAVGGGWSVQLLLPSYDEPIWSDAGLGEVSAEVDSAYRPEGNEQPTPSLLAGPDDTGEPVAEFAGTGVIRFELRVQRPECTFDPQIIQLDVSGVASLADSDAIVGTSGIRADLLQLQPELAPVPAEPPSVTIQDVSINPASFSLEDQIISGTVTIAVENPVHRCIDWSITVAVQAFVSDNVQNLTTLTAIGELIDVPPGIGLVASASPPGQSLTDPVIVSIVQSGAEPGSYTQTIGFDLTIPGRTKAGSYDARATASVQPEEP